MIWLTRTAASYHKRGKAHSKKGNPEKAVQEFTRAINHAPNYAHCYHDRGAAYLNMGLVEQAIDGLSTAIQLSPEPQFYASLGTAHYRAGDHKVAVQYYSCAINMNNDVHAKAVCMRISIRRIQFHTGFERSYMRIWAAISRLFMTTMLRSAASLTRLNCMCVAPPA
jgi:tetratricopeptide (TPR) repeat protein